MGDLAKIQLKTQYHTGEENLVSLFYIPCIGQAIQYRRAVGYFRSSVFAIIGKEILQFASRGGSFRLICSPELSEEDLEIIDRTGDVESTVTKSMLDSLESLMLINGLRARTEILATLLKIGCLEIRIAVNKHGNGIYHDKVGIFTDEADNNVSFIGSANETWNGWHFLGNHEYLEVFQSIAGPSDVERTRNHLMYFERLWANQSAGISVLRLPEAVEKRILKVAPSDPDRIEIDEKGATPMLSPLPHQLEAIHNWNANGRRGILKHATGSGKTYTAILALQQHFDEGNPALILVPSSLLLEQWRREIETHISETVVLVISSDNQDQSKYKKMHAMTASNLDKIKSVVLTTIQSASSEEFRTSISQGPHLLLIADEVHQIGSAEYSKCMSIETGPRLGLSATPERYGDPKGTRKILDYFGGILVPVISLQDAINMKRLVQYQYYPHIVNLIETEQKEWIDLTIKIEREIAIANSGNHGQFIINDRAKMLLIKRSRIAKKAREKTHLAIRILSENYKSGERWLVYCEDRDQLRDVIKELQISGKNPIEYMSEMNSDKQAALSSFIQSGGILVSVRCLDEGIDIPLISHAIILASSQNPRQFIQRRGRVLRKTQSKTSATIHDALVFPPTSTGQEKYGSLVKSEIKRALEFSKSAMNRSGEMEIRIEARRRGIWSDEFEDSEEGEDNANN